jgi:Mrp family chromosome partitioning ATPase/capsular polysaccharide biosynthesis protein
LNRRYFLSLKQYGWIVIACTLLALLAGFVFLKKEPQVYQVSSTMYVVADAPTNTFNPTLSATDSVGLANNYASQIISRSVMDYVYQSDPQIAQHGYGPEDLLADVITTPSITASTILITASAVNANDAVLMANDVARGFQTYIQTQNQQQLNTLRSNLQSQMTAVEKQKSATEGAIIALASTTDPHYSVYNAELNDEIHTIDTIQTQLLTLPATANSNIVTIQFATTKDAVPAVKSNLILAITAGIGLLIGTLIMLLVIYIDKRLQDGEQVSEKLGIAYLGGISRSKEFANNPAQTQGVVARQIGDIGANLRLTGVLPDQRQTTQGDILLITSAQSTEGKTTITHALAATMARGGSTVVVVDGNLRQPATHLAFGMKTTGPGLSGLLKAPDREDIDAYAIVQRSHLPGVWLLAAGMPIDDPVLLLGRKMPEILVQLRKKVDVVIIDGPAILSGAEASVFASMADGVAWVVDARHNKLSLLLRSKEILNSLTHTPTGIIMNGLARRGQNSYYASAYSTVATAQDWMSIALNTANGSDAGRVQNPEPIVTLSTGPLMASFRRYPSSIKNAGMPPQALSIPSRTVDMTSSHQ